MTKTEIIALLDTSNLAVTRAVLAIHARQTVSEQASHQSSEHNKVGFNSYDAGFFSSIADQLNNGWNLTDKQINAARRGIKKYWKQLQQIAEENN